jgi:hypothetical protein
MPIELKVKVTNDTVRSASNIELHLEIDSEVRLEKELRQKRQFECPTVNFPFICTNNPAALTY